jgi:hypothetical protein
VSQDPHTTEQAPGEPLYGSVSASTPEVGISGGSDPLNGPQAAAEDFESGREGANGPLRQQIAAALAGCQGGTTWGAMADAVRAVIQPHLDRLAQAETELQQWVAAESADAAAGSYAGRAEEAEAAIARVRAAADQLHRAVHNADGKPLTAYDRGVDTAVRRVLSALDEPAPTHNAGPTARECAANDRRWPLEKHGE